MSNTPTNPSFLVIKGNPPPWIAGSHPTNYFPYANQLRVLQHLLSNTLLSDALVKQLLLSDLSSLDFQLLIQEGRRDR